jgi:hypothetical protein
VHFSNNFVEKKSSVAILKPQLEKSGVSEVLGAFLLKSSGVPKDNKKGIIS